MVKVKSSTGNIVMNHYNKFNLSLKYEEYNTEQPNISYSVSLYHNDKKLFTDSELLITNDNAINFIKENQDLNYEVSDNIEGINIYLYYFEPANKWFVSTKKQINNHEIYKSLVRAMNYEKINFNIFDKKFVYVLKLVSNKFIRFCSYSRFNKYDYIFFYKKINRITNEEFFVDDQHIFQRSRQIIDYKDKYNNIEEFINLNMKGKILNAFKENGYVRYVGLTISCFKDNKYITLNIDSTVYKFLNEMNYDYQKYKIKPIDVLFFSYLLSHDEVYKKKIIEILKIEYMPVILSRKLGEYGAIIDRVCEIMAKFYLSNDNSNFKSLEYFKTNFNKYIESVQQQISQQIPEKELPSIVCDYFKMQSINIFFSIFKSIKKGNVYNFNN